MWCVLLLLAVSIVWSWRGTLYKVSLGFDDVSTVVPVGSNMYNAAFCSRLQLLHPTGFWQQAVLLASYLLVTLLESTVRSDAWCVVFNMSATRCLLQLYAGKLSAGAA